jgi:Tol biopolymer transport system component
MRWLQQGAALTLFACLAGCHGKPPTEPFPGAKCEIIAPVSSWVSLPAWAPDGKRIAVISERDVNGLIARGLYVIDVRDGTAVCELDSAQLGRSAAWLAWSPTGDGLAMWRSGSVLVYELGSRVWRQVSDPMRHADAPAWSPDGEWLYYTSVAGPLDSEPASGLVLTDLRTGWTRPVVSRDGGAVWPLGPISFSPDGEWFTFIAGVPGPSPEASTSFEVFKMRRDGRDRTQLTSLGGLAGDAQWLRDGSGIVFNFAKSECAELGYAARHAWRVTTDGAVVERWPGELGDVRVPEGIRPAFSADGRWVAFAGVDEQVESGVLVVMSITGSHRLQVFPRPSSPPSHSGLRAPRADG